jgi:hypothetical protein
MLCSAYALSTSCGARLTPCPPRAVPRFTPCSHFTLCPASHPAYLARCPASRRAPLHTLPGFTPCPASLCPPHAVLRLHDLCVHPLLTPPPRPASGSRRSGPVSRQSWDGLLDANVPLRAADQAHAGSASRQLVPLASMWVRGGSWAVAGGRGGGGAGDFLCSCHDSTMPVEGRCCHLGGRAKGTLVRVCGGRAPRCAGLSVRSA